MNLLISEKMKKILTSKIKFNYLLIIMMISTTLLTFPWIPFFNLLKYITIFLSITYVFVNMKILLFQNKFAFINVFIILLASLSICFSYFSNVNLQRNPFFATTSDKLILISWVFVLELVYIKGDFKSLLRIIKNCLLIIVGTSVVITTIFGDIVFFNGNYILGDKFVLSYAALFMLCFYSFYISYAHHRNYKLKITIMWLLCLLLSIRVGCATGIVSFILFALFALFALIIKNKNNNLIYILLFILISVMSVLFVFCYNPILNIAPIKFFIENILDKNITLTTRTRIYDDIIRVILPKIFTGYGFGSSYEISMRFISAPNLQNGIFNCILEEGIIITIFYWLFILYCIIKSRNNNYLKNYFLIMMVISSVEIVFNTQLLVISFLMYIISVSINDGELRLCAKNVF